MTIQLFERETTILWSDESKTKATIETPNVALQRKLESRGLVGKVKHEFEGVTYKEYQVPKAWVKITPPRKMSEEQKKSAGERLNKLREQGKI